MATKCVPTTTCTSATPRWPEEPRTAKTLIDFDALIKGKELQSSGTNFMDKTLKHHESTYKITFLVWSNIWYTICIRAGSPFPLIKASKTMNMVGVDQKSTHQPDLRLRIKHTLSATSNLDYRLEIVTTFDLTRQSCLVTRR